MNRATSGNVFDDDKQPAPATTVQARKRVGALLSSLSAVLKVVGVYDACHALKGQIIDPLDPKKKRRLEFDANEMRRVIETVMEAAQIAEIEAEATAGNDAPFYSINRRFRLPAYRMELLFRRETMPNFAPDDEGEKAKQTFINSYARCWQRRWKKLHIVQSYLHLGLIDKERGISETAKKIPPLYTDRITDLVIKVGQATTGAKAIQKKQYLVTHYSRAAVPVIEEFKQVKAHVYAPDWKMPDAPEVAESETVTDAAPASKETVKKLLRVAVKNFAAESLAQIAALNLDEDEEVAFRLELQRTFDAALVGAPLPPAGGDSDASSSVILNSDNAGKADISAPSEAPDLVNSLSNNADSSNLDGTPASHLNLSPEEQFCLAADAVSSVGGDKVLAVWLSIKPMGAEATVISTDRLSPSQLRASAAKFIGRSLTCHQSVAVRIGRGKTTFLDQPRMIQIDDESLQFHERIRPFSFFGAETSLACYQDFLCIADELTDEEFESVRSRFFKQRELEKEAANGGARNSIRWPGTANAKEKHRAADSSFPLVRLAHVAMGRKVFVRELEESGMLAAPEPQKVVSISSRRPQSSRLPSEWPDYQACAASVAAKDSGSPDLNRADEKYCIIALSAGWPRYMVEDKLRSLRDKAARRPDYVRRTLDAAERWLASHSDNKRVRVAV
jgi:hypothetical protein